LGRSRNEHRAARKALPPDHPNPSRSSWTANSSAWGTAPGLCRCAIALCCRCAIALCCRCAFALCCRCAIALCCRCAIALCCRCAIALCCRCAFALCCRCAIALCCRCAFAPQPPEESASDFPSAPDNQYGRGTPWSSRWAGSLCTLCSPPS